MIKFTGGRALGKMRGRKLGPYASQAVKAKEKSQKEMDSPVPVDMWMTTKPCL